MTIASIEPEAVRHRSGQDAFGQERRRSSALSLLMEKWERAKEVVLRKDSANPSSDAQLDGAAAKTALESVRQIKWMGFRERAKKVPGLSRLVDAIAPADSDDRYYTYDPAAGGWCWRVRSAEDKRDGIDVSPAPQRSHLRREACIVETSGKSADARQDDLDTQENPAAADENTQGPPLPERSPLRPQKWAVLDEATLSARPDIAGLWECGNEAEEGADGPGADSAEHPNGGRSREGDPLDVPGSALTDGRRRINAQEELERLGR